MSGGGESGARCLLCERDSQAVPLVAFEYRGERRHVCTEHLPVLIHDPGRLADRLEGRRRGDGAG